MKHYKEVDSINKMLSSIPKQHASVKDQMLFERGYLTGFLAMLASEDPYIRRRIDQRIKQLTKKSGA